MDDLWSLFGLLFVISIPLLMVLFAVVGSLLPGYDWQRVTMPPMPPMPAHPRVPPNPARFFAGAGGIEDMMPDNRQARGPR
ncbi:hypothetical protein ACFYM3_37260 [Streptomyces massasporeus]|uniref:Uncharacterized protein n=1 Tax=Streptomyces massasporeus TaxID=67324 RepID=A0ABW6LNY6_9ACTN